MDGFGMGAGGAGCGVGGWGCLTVGGSGGGSALRHILPALA